MVLFQNISPGPPSSLLQVAVKNNQQPVWYFNDKFSLSILFTEDGRMERATFLEVRVFELIVFNSVKIKRHISLYYLNTYKLRLAIENF